MYKVEIYSDKRGHVQRDEKSKEIKFSNLSKLKTWIKESCDLRHNVLTKAENLRMKVETLVEKRCVEFSLKFNATVIVTF